MELTRQELLAENIELKRRLQQAEATLEAQRAGSAEALVAEGKLCREILLQAVPAIAICDRSGRITQASRGLHELCGQNPLFLPFQLALPLKLPGYQTSLLALLFQGENLHNIEANFQQPGGRKVHVLVNAGPLLTEGAEIGGYVVAFTDITDRIEAEADKQKLLEELQQREEELQALNEELQVLNEELLSQTDELRCQTVRLHARNDELQVLTKKLHVQTDELETANREILTAHKALQESREDLNRAQAVAHTGSWRLDVRQNKLTWSDEAHRIFGIPQGTPMSYETFLAAVHPEDREYVNQNWLVALKGEPYDIEHRIVVDDTVKWVRERAELEFDTRGRLLGGFGTTQDITERKQAEEALRESEERLRQAAQAGRMFAFEWDPETDAVKRSPEAGLILGLSGDAALHDHGQDFFGKIYPADRAPFIQKLHDLNPGADRYIADYRIIRADNGQVVWLEEIAHALFDAQGRMHRLYGMTMDVTERKEAEAALQTAHIRVINEKNRLEAVMQTLPVGVAILDEQGGNILCNPMFEEVWGSPRPVTAEIKDYQLYKAWWLDTGKQVQPEEWASAQAVQQGETVIGQLLEIERFDGVRRYVINSGAPIRDADGKITGCAVAIFDITEHRRAEEALRESEERYRSLVELSPDAILVCTEGKYVFANQAAARLFGAKTPTDMVGQDVLDLVTHDFREFVERRIKEVLAGDREEQQEAKIMRLDGQSVDVEASAQAIGYQGRQSLLIIFRDITERKQAEAALRRAHDELEDQVRQRTKDLQFTVTQLQEEVLERLRAEAKLTKQSKLVQDLYNRAPCGYHSLDPEGKFVQINDTELIWLGYSREEVVGRMSFADLLTAESQQRFRQNFPGFVERGEVYDLEYQMIRQDGTVFPVLLSATAVRDEAGNFLMSRGTVFDLTARVQAEAALASERQRLFQVLEHLPAYVVLLAPDYTVPYANREFIRRFGVAKAGQRCYEFLFGPDKACEHCQTYQVLETDAGQEWEWQGPDGRNYAVFDYPFTDVDGSPLILELGLDITARRQAEQALRESEERLRFLANQLLTSQEQERKRLASELHDELGHALLTLKLSLGAIARKLLPEQENVKELLQEQLEYISHVIEEVRRLYYDLSPGDLEDLGLTKALENLVEDFGSHQPDISFHVDLPELAGGLSLPVQTIIYRLLQEALTNIGKHAEPTQVNVSAQKENGRLCLVIEDDGRGFDLSQVDRDPHRGLGLAAMRERLYIVGGSLEIWSQKGAGNKVDLYDSHPARGCLYQVAIK